MNWRQGDSTDQPPSLRLFSSKKLSFFISEISLVRKFSIHPNTNLLQFGLRAMLDRGFEIFTKPEFLS